MGAPILQGRVGLLRGPFGGLIGASVGCSAWQLRVLADAQGVGMVQWAFLALLFVVSITLAPTGAYWALMEQRWSGLKTLVLYVWYLGVTNAVFVGAGHVLGVRGALEQPMLVPVLVVTGAFIAGLLLLLFPPIRSRITANLEAWRDSR
jgi:hypothetical protein